MLWGLSLMPCKIFAEGVISKYPLKHPYRSCHPSTYWKISIEGVMPNTSINVVCSVGVKSAITRKIHTINVMYIQLPTNCVQYSCENVTPWKVLLEGVMSSTALTIFCTVVVKNATHIENYLQRVSCPAPFRSPAVQCPPDGPQSPSGPCNRQLLTNTLSCKLIIRNVCGHPFNINY